MRQPILHSPPRAASLALVSVLALSACGDSGEPTGVIAPAPPEA